MRLPRWTVYPALALLAILTITAVPRRATDPYAGAAAARISALNGSGTPALPPAKYPRIVVLGIDGMDPEILQETIDRFPDRMRNFQWLADRNGIHSLGTSTPPQSPVAWSNFITGRDPGGHGIYDFIHRSRVHRTPITSATTEGDDPFHVGLWSDWQLAVPMPWQDAPEDNRSGDAFWTILADRGIPADIWRMPANFPVIPSKGLSFSGMLTPAVDSAYGEFSFYTTNPPADLSVSNGRIIAVQEFNGLIDTYLTGPANSFKEGIVPVTTPMTITIDRSTSPPSAAIDGGGGVIVLQPGAWSDFTTVSFEPLPMGLSAVTGITRFYLRSIDPEFELYASPVNIDPVAPMSPVSEPSDASADLADRRTGIGPYYTQGMAEEVNGLKAKVLTDGEFLDQTKLVYEERRRMMEYALDHYLEDDEGGLLFFYYSTVDLCCHMLWRHADEEHPAHDHGMDDVSTAKWSKREGSTWKDVVHDLYLKMDPVLGRLRERLGDDGATLIVMSDHGFAPYHRKFSLNTWLYDNGYLVLKDGFEKELPADDPERRDVQLYVAADWSKTRAYGIGFNGLYLNLAGREADDPKTPEDESGIVKPGAEAEALIAELKTRLEAIRDPKTGAQVVLRCDKASEVYSGERVEEAPDLVVGYNSGYGNSDPSTLGRVTHDVLEDNLGGTFNGNHLMSPDVVAGVLLSNTPVRSGVHRLRDLTVEILARYGVEAGPGMDGHRVLE